MLITTPLYAKDLGTIGNTYRIAEKDILQEILKRGSEINWQAAISKEREKLEKQAPIAKLKLPPADKNYSYYVDMTYTLDHDIHRYDTSGNITGILYKAGYTYNPLDYRDITEIYVIINGNRQCEIDWFNEHYKDFYNARPIITEGDAFEVAAKLQREVFMLQQFQKLFTIKNTVSVIYEDFSRKMMRVDVIRISDEKNNNNLTDPNS